MSYLPDINNAKVAGVATAVNSGNKDNGTQRMVLATDQPPVPVSGGLTNNNAVPAATNVGVLPALANVASPVDVEGDQVLLSTDLSGNLRTSDVGDLIVLQASQVSGITNVTTTRTVTTGMGKYKDLAIIISFTAGSVATGTLQIFIEDDFDGGTFFTDLCASNTFAFGAVATRQMFFISGRAVSALMTGAVSVNTTQGVDRTLETMAAGSARQGPFGNQLRIREKVSGVSGSPTGVTYTVTCVAKG